MLSSYGENDYTYNMASVRHTECKSVEFWSHGFRYCPNLLWLKNFIKVRLYLTEIWRYNDCQD